MGSMLRGGRSSGTQDIRSGPDVLLIEGEAPLRALLRRIVESVGYGALEARDYPEALHLLSGAARSVRLVLVDLAEPGISGVQGLRRHLPGGAKLLLLSTATSERAEVRALPDGVAFYLANPFRADVLAAKVRELLEER